MIDSKRPNSLVILTTGGTIEKIYDEREGTLTNREGQIYESIQNRMRLPHTKLDVFSLMNKDSLEMTDVDRNLVVEAIRAQLDKETPIVVLHGTDTMGQTAKLAFERLGELDVPVVFTGAMRPLGLLGSDANQNLAEAMMAARLLPNGVYICFHGEVFPLPHVKKNRDRGTFEFTQ